MFTWFTWSRVTRCLLYTEPSYAVFTVHGAELRGVYCTRSRVTRCSLKLSTGIDSYFPLVRACADENLCVRSYDREAEHVYDGRKHAAPYGRGTEVLR